MEEEESNHNKETQNPNVNEPKLDKQIDCKTEQVSADNKNTEETIIDCKTEQVSAGNKNTEETIVDCKTEQVSADNKNTEATVVKLNEIKDKSMMDEDDGEDLPDNFFDDFSNNDFMAGLDIVDDWMDEDEDVEKRRERGDDYFQDDAELRDKSSERKPEVKHDVRRQPSPKHRPRHGDRNYLRRDRSREDEKYRRNPDRSFDRKSRDREFDRRRSRERDLERRRSRSRDRNRDERRSRDRFRSRDRSRPREYEKHSSDIKNSKDGPVEENDSRRDPEKTKRDIQRDKLRCAKDFEARVFQEQLKVAETGLVPPGTELDVVMEHEKRKQEEHVVVENPPERKKEEAPPLPRLMDVKVSVERFQRKDEAKSKSRGRYSRDQHSRDRDRDRRSRERHSRERRSRERRSRERRSRERHSRERHSRERHSRERDLRDRRLSPDFRFRKREYSRFNRSKDRSLSPRIRRRSRSLDREENYRRNDDLRLRLREKRRERYFNELSPVSEAKFSRSPSLTNLSLISNISEREFWLRNRDKYKSRYRRSCSPVSSSSLSDLGSPRRKRPKKASFMEEIERKLREKRPQTSTSYGSPVVSNPEPPQPVPPPQQFHQQMPMSMGFQPQNVQMFQQGMVPNPYSQPQVDHEMMMHHHQQQMMPMMMMESPAPMAVLAGPGIMGPHPGMVEQPQQLMLPHLNQMHMQQMQLQQPMNSPVIADSGLHRIASNLKPCVSDANKEVTKLFEEQKISLSDYLSVAAKPIDPKCPGIDVHKKIKVISKCQDVIRVLKEDSKFCGRFFPKPAPPGYEKQEDNPMKWKSPLRKTFPVRFMFTTPHKKTPTQQEFVKNIINKLLFVCGIPVLPTTLPAAISHSAVTNTPNTNSKSSQNITTSQANVPKPVPAPISFSVSQQKPKNVALAKPSVLITRSTIGLQTDPVKCQICEIRSARKFSDEACQTSEKDMVDESTQVTNEDLLKSMVTFTPRGILKNSSSSLQSLSHLTPAQLLALQQEKSDDGWNIASRNETFPISRSQEQFNSPGNFMGRNHGNSLTNTSFNANLGMGIMGRSNTVMSGNNFSSGFIGNMQNRPFSSQQNSSMNSGNSVNDFQNMANRNADSRSGNFDNRFPNDKYSPEKNFNDANNMNFNRNMGSNMGGNIGNLMSSNMSNRGRGGTANNRGFFMGYGGQNRTFYNN